MLLTLPVVERSGLCWCSVAAGIALCLGASACSGDDRASGPPEDDASPVVDGSHEAAYGTSNLDADHVLADATLGADADAATLDAAADAGLDATLDADTGTGSVDAAPDADAAPTDAGCSPVAQRLAVSSTGVALPNPLQLAAVCNGSAGTTPTVASPGFVLTNTSTAPVTWTAHPSSTYFALDSVGSTLAPGDSATVNVSAVALTDYPPGETVADGVIVTEDDPIVCPHIVPVQESFEGYFFAPPTLNFGDVPVGDGSTLHVTATFTGGPYFAGVLSGSSTEFRGTVQAGPGPITGLDVTFAPAGIGPRSGTVSFNGFMNAVCTPPIAASGNGTAPPPPPCASLDAGASCGGSGVCVGLTCTTQLVAIGVPFSFPTGSPLTATVGRVSDVLASDTAAALSANIAWGDGTTSAGTVSGATGQFSVSGTHTYSTAAIVSGTVTVTDGATGSSAAASFQTGPAIAVTTFSVSGATGGIATGNDGNLWFPGAGAIQTMTPAGVVTSFDDFAVNAGNDLATNQDIALGPDGNLWFAAGAGIGRSTDAGVTSSFVPGGTPGAFTAGPGGDVWFTEPAANQIGRITPAGAITEFPVPTAGSSPLGIAAGADGNVWFTEFASQKIGRITPSGTVTEVAQIPGLEPASIVAGPDGNLWFIDQTGTTFQRITPAGARTPFTIPGSSTAGAGGGLTVGADGNLWLTSGSVHRLSRITTSGVVSVYFVANSFYDAITAGPDGNLWALDHVSGQIARITPPSL